MINIYNRKKTSTKSMQRGKGSLEIAQDKTANTASDAGWFGLQVVLWASHLPSILLWLLLSLRENNYP